MTLFELQYELDELVQTQEALLLDGMRGAAEELIPQIDELCMQIDALEQEAW